MRIAIIELGTEDLADAFIREVSARIETANFSEKMALDLFDVLAFAKQAVSNDHVIIIAQLNPEEKELNNAFYEGLAVLEAETGKNIFKAIFTEEDDSKTVIKELSEKFVNYLFYPAKLKAKAPRPKKASLSELRRVLRAELKDALVSLEESRRRSPTDALN